MKRLLPLLFALLPAPAAAVTVNPEGLGQALIFPYYTARDAGGSGFNTYLSIVNHAADAKALRVRFREGRQGKETLAFNLFLGPRDAWAGAVVPAGAGARLLSRDASCADPGYLVDFSGDQTPYLVFRADAFTDGAGAGEERAREGFVEVLEMATLTGASAQAATHLPSGSPANCGALRAIPAGGVAAPSGGISGTLTLINVANGMDFTVNAEALADLAERPYFRPPSDPYPAFTAEEIDPVSTTILDGRLYRSLWNRGLDAVSAALMRRNWQAEYSLDPGTRSASDLVLTLPTRHHHFEAGTARAPFTQPPNWSPSCGAPASPALGEALAVDAFNREERTVRIESCDFLCPPIMRPPTICAAAAVVSLLNGAAHLPSSIPPSSVLGSTTGGAASGLIPVVATSPGGWVRFDSNGRMVSLSTSTVTDLSTGETTNRELFHFGLPVVGFVVRTFANGTLRCAGASCQGNYGGAFPLGHGQAVSFTVPAAQGSR